MQIPQKSQKQPNQSSKHAKELKELCYRYEKQNLSHVIMVPSTDGWAKLIENSALIYYFNIGPKLKDEKHELVEDKDYIYRSQRGVILINKPTKFAKDLMDSKMFTEQITKDELTFFKLKVPYTKSEINALKKSADREREDINTIKNPTFSAPKVFAASRELKIALRRYVADLKPQAYNAYGVSIMNWLHHLETSETKAITGIIDSKQFLANIHYICTAFNLVIGNYGEAHKISLSKQKILARLIGELDAAANKKSNEIKGAKNA